jgi:hypothetical protein
MPGVNRQAKRPQPEFLRLRPDTQRCNLPRIKKAHDFATDQSVPMSPNDPLGSLSRRQAQAYQRCREQLQAQGIVDADAARQKFSLLGRNVLMFVVVILAASVLAAALLRDQLTLISILASLAVLWMGSRFLQSRDCLARYLNELREHESTGSGSPAHKQPQQEEIR